MRVLDISKTCALVAIAGYASLSHANPYQNDNRWAPEQPTNPYWQAPKWSGFDTPARQNTPPPQRYNNRYGSAPAAPPAPSYRQPQRAGNYPAAPPVSRPGPVRSAPPAANRGYPPPPPQGPYRSTTAVPDSGASAFYTPGYQRNRGSGWRNNKFWGRSGPGSWMNPNKNNLERGWDDMMNAPSRMGEMPGGWTAPEVSMPNPVDIGDQMQDNVKDLPDQVKDMDVGNN